MRLIRPMKTVLLTVLMLALVSVGLASTQASAATVTGAEDVPAACAQMHADTVLTAENYQLAAICPETRAPASVVARAVADGIVQPDAGGPTCNVIDHGVTKVCFNKSTNKWQLVSEWQQLMPPFGTPPSNFASELWGYVKSITKNHYLRACTAGAIGGVIAGAPFGPEGALAGGTGGCVTGVLAYWWL